MYGSNKIKDIQDAFVANDRIAIELMTDVGLDDLFLSVYKKVKLFHNDILSSWGAEESKKEYTSLQAVRMICDLFERLQKTLQEAGRIISSGAFNAFQETISQLKLILNHFRINDIFYERTKNKLKRIAVLEAIGINEYGGYNPRLSGWVSNEDIVKKEKKDAALNYAKDNIEEMLKFCYEHGFDVASFANKPEVYQDHLDPQSLILYERVNSFDDSSFKKKIVRDFVNK